jgi:hypothetical protein
MEVWVRRSLCVSGLSGWSEKVKTAHAGCNYCSGYKLPASGKLRARVHCEFSYQDDFVESIYAHLQFASLNSEV